MGILLKNNQAIFLLAFFVFMLSCNTTTEFNAYKTISDATWNANEKVSFQFEITDTITPKNIFINIRNNNNYEFSNFYVITTLQFPNGNTITDTLQYEMADATGKFLGKGFTEIKESKLFYKEKKVFPITGEYEFSMYQAMRKNNEIQPIPCLKGIQEVGFSIENF